MYGVNLNWNGTAAVPFPHFSGWSSFLKLDWGAGNQEGFFRMYVPDDSISRKDENDEELSLQMMRLSQASFKEIWSDPAEDIWDTL